MDEVSNRTIALLTVIAVIASIGGVLLSMNQLGRLGFPLITGAVTSMPAYVNLSIVSETAIFVSNNIDFESGQINYGNNFCVFNSSATSCANGTHSGGALWDWTSQYILINNTGTTNISVNFTSDKAAAAFIGGDTVTPSAKIVPRTAPAGGNNYCITTPVEISTSTQSLCPKLMRSGYSQDTTVNIDALLIVPLNTPANAKIANLTFTASQNSS